MGVPIIRTIVFWGLYWGPLILGNYHLGRGTLVLDRVFSCGEAWLLGGEGRGAVGGHNAWVIIWASVQMFWSEFLIVTEMPCLPSYFRGCMVGKGYSSACTMSCPKT